MLIAEAEVMQRTTQLRNADTPMHEKYREYQQLLQDRLFRTS